MAAAKLDFSQFLDATIIPNLKRPAATAPVAGSVEVVLLTCMDFRYPRRVVETMEKKHLTGKYDHLILAGASLGVLHKAEWQTTFLDQLKFAVDKHGASQVIILDHRDCGAYKEFLNVTPDDPAKELEAHRCECQKAMQLIVSKFPALAGRVYSQLLPIEHIDDLGRA